MAVTCASRFSVLRLEDDDIFEKTSEKNQTQNKTSKTMKSNAKNATAADTKTKPKKKKKSTNDIAELQNLAFGNGLSKPKNKNNQNSSSKGTATVKQWEEWKKKDNEFVSGAYEQDLEQALLLSKIDYEENKEVYESVPKEPEQKQNLKKKKKNNQKKEKGTMSLDEFQKYSLDTDTGNKNKNDVLDDFNSPPKLPVPNEPDFFHSLNEDVEKIINKEQRSDSFKKREDCRVPDIALSLEYQEKLAKKDEEINGLNNEITRLKTELKTVKTRNKKLYDILAAGEMKEKAEILVEIRDLTLVKDELNEQLSEYHQLLEIERSKVHALQGELKKCHNSRKDRKESKESSQ